MELILIFLLIVLNGLFSMSEIAVVSARRARLKQLEKRGDRKARTALQLATSPNIFLATIQIGITLVGVMTGAFGEAMVADDLAIVLARIDWLAPYAKGVALFFVIVGITYLSLVIGELVPKRLGLHNPERIARAIALPMLWLSRVTSPLVRLLGASTELILRLLRIKPRAEVPITEDELRTLIEEGTSAGVFAHAERDLLKNVLRLADRPIDTLMQPRAEVVWLDLDAPLEEAHRKMAQSPHSRFPVARDGLDNLVGIVQAKDLLAQTLAGEPMDIERAMQPALHVPDTTSALRLLEIFRRAPIPTAVIVDEYGEIKGLVSLNDILEAIVGDISGADADAEQRVVRRADGSWLLDGLLPVGELKELLNVGELPNEAEADYQTLGGVVMHQLGRIPNIGDTFSWQRFRFEVVDMDGKRIDRVLVSPLETPADAGRPAP